MSTVVISNPNTSHIVQASAPQTAPQLQVQSSVPAGVANPVSSLTSADPAAKTPAPVASKSYASRAWDIVKAPFVAVYSWISSALSYVSGKMFGTGKGATLTATKAVEDLSSAINAESWNVQTVKDAFAALQGLVKNKDKEATVALNHLKTYLWVAAGRPMTVAVTTEGAPVTQKAVTKEEWADAEVANPTNVSAFKNAVQLLKARPQLEALVANLKAAPQDAKEDVIEKILAEGVKEMGEFALDQFEVARGIFGDAKVAQRDAGVMAAQRLLGHDFGLVGEKEKVALSHFLDAIIPFVAHDVPSMLVKSAYSTFKKNAEKNSPEALELVKGLVVAIGKGGAEPTLSLTNVDSYLAGTLVDGKVATGRVSFCDNRNVLEGLVEALGEVLEFDVAQV